MHKMDKIQYPITSKINIYYRLMDIARIWWDSYGLNYEEMKEFPNVEYEKLALDKWSHVVQKDKKTTGDLFSCDNFVL